MIDELEVFDYEEYKKNGSKTKHSGDFFKIGDDADLVVVRWERKFYIEREYPRLCNIEQLLVIANPESYNATAKRAMKTAECYGDIATSSVIAK